MDSIPLFEAPRPVRRPISAATAAEIQSDMFADDIDMPDWRGWREDDLREFFESAGTLRPPSHRLPVEDTHFTALCEKQGLHAIAREQLFGASLTAMALLYRRDQRACQRWATARGLSSEDWRKLSSALRAFNGSNNDAAPTPIIIKATHGLCNKLRVVLAHLIIAQEARRPLIVIWRSHHNCPGRFDEFFEPLHDVTFVDDDIPLPTDFVSCDCHPSIKYTDNEPLIYHALRPRAHVMAAVAANVRALGGAFAAVHIRRTDHVRPEQTTCAPAATKSNTKAPLAAPTSLLSHFLTSSHISSHVRIAKARGVYPLPRLP